MKKTLLLFIFLYASLGFGQHLDSLAVRSKFNYKSIIIPSALIVSGAMLVNSNLNQKIQEEANSFFGADFHEPIDNVFTLIPVAQIYAGRYLGFQPENNFRQQTINLAVANTATLVVVMALKNTIKEERPDFSDDLSFPSGHTAIAFTNASLLFYEYKDSNIWYASSGYLFATATGVLRVANNRHYTSDVLTGAGIGLLSGILVSHYNPFQSLKFGKNKKSSALLFPQIGNKIGLGMVLNLE